MTEELTSFVQVFGGDEFDRIRNLTCFVCGDPAATAEHVPPASVGGRELLNACKRCNNELGARIDEPLSRRVRHRYRGRFMDPAQTVPGARRVDVYLGVDEERAITHVGTSFDHDPDLVALTGGGGQFELTFSEPDPHAVQCGLLKTCYLAESALIGRPLQGAQADAVRSHLVSIVEGNAPDASTLVEVEVIHAPTSLQLAKRSRPRFAVGRVSDERQPVPLISYGRFACFPVFTEDPDLAEVVAAWPGISNE